MRKASCPFCGYTLRVSREWIAHGLPVCPCGAQIEPECLHDRIVAPGAVGELAWSQLRAAQDDSAQRSEYALRRSPQHRCPTCQAFRQAGAGADPTNPQPCPSCGSLERAIRPPRKVKATDDIPF